MSSIFFFKNEYGRNEFIAMVQLCCDHDPLKRPMFETLLELLEQIKEKGNEKQREKIIATALVKGEGEYIDDPQNHQ